VVCDSELAAEVAVCCGSVEAPLKVVWCDLSAAWESPPVGESVAVGLGVTGAEVEFLVGVDARCNRLQIC
jgi:hypothetical protein